MKTLRELMQQWPSVAAFARDIEIPPTHAHVMLNRGRIPVDYWPRILRAARQRKIKGVSPELLLELDQRDRVA